MSTTSNESEICKLIPSSRQLKRKKKRIVKKKAATATVTSVTPTIDASSESSIAVPLNVTTSENNVERPQEDSRHGTLIREYLHQTIVPALLVGMKDLVRERPLDPLGFLAAFLLKYKNEHANEDSTYKIKD